MTQTKADTLGLLSGLFQRLHADCTTLMKDMERPRLPSCVNKGDFGGRAYRRAATDWQRSQKATHALRKKADVALTAALAALPFSRSPKRQKRLLKLIDKTSHTLTQMRNREAVYGHPFKPPFLKVELIDAAQVQAPRTATHFDLWMMVQGAGKLYLPANKHRALNRALALPGATLCEQGEVYRKNGKWYCRVAVQVPIPEEHPINGWLGVDVGIRAAITCSDGYQGPDLRPILAKQRIRHADQQRHMHPADFGVMTPQRQALAHEARKLVSRAHETGRGIALETPDRLPAWKQWAARFFAERVLLLATVAGVPVWLCDPSYTSLTCSRCGSKDTYRHKRCFRCLACGFTLNADLNASRVIRCRASRASCGSQTGLGLVAPHGGGAHA